MSELTYKRLIFLRAFRSLLLGFLEQLRLSSFPVKVLSFTVMV